MSCTTGIYQEIAKLMRSVGYRSVISTINTFQEEGIFCLGDKITEIEYHDSDKKKESWE